MKRLIALLLCIFLTVPFMPAGAEIEDWVADINGISAKVLEWCMQEHQTELMLELPKSATAGMTDDEIWRAVWDSMDEYCRDDYQVRWNRTTDGGIRVRLSNVSLRPGLLMAEAYWGGDTSRLNADEKKCLKQLTSLTDKMVKQYGYATVDTELAIYDYICDHVTYRTYPKSDSRHNQCTSAANALLHGWGNCQAYSDLFFLMTMMTGFDSGYISGMGNGGAHLWNTISIGGEQVMVDVTFGDTEITEYPVQQTHYYFNFGRDRLDSHTWSPAVFDPSWLSRKTNDSYSFYSNKKSRFGTTALSAAEAAKFCVNQAGKGRKHLEVLIKGKTYDKKALESAMENRLKNTRGKWNYNYHIDHVDGNTVFRVNWILFKGKKIK